MVLDETARTRDLLGGLLMFVIGAAASFQGRQYQIGSLTRMGPGFMPVVLGVLLASLGVLIALGALRRGPAIAAKPLPGELVDATTDWRGVLCILGGLAAFVVLGSVGGLIPASFFCVFVAAMGDRSATLRSSAALALCMTVAAVLLFHYGLGLRLPLIGS